MSISLNRSLPKRPNSGGLLTLKNYIGRWDLKAKCVICQKIVLMIFPKNLVKNVPFLLNSFLRSKNPSNTLNLTFFKITYFWHDAENICVSAFLKRKPRKS